MDMSGMSGMGMDMATASMFTPTNKHIAHVYWYLVAAVVAVLVFRRLVDRFRIFYAYVFLKVESTSEQVIPFRPDNILAQSYDTVIAIARELSYPQLYTFTGKFSRYFTPPSLGKCLFILAYWLVILTMLWSNTILHPSSPNYAYKWEIVGFRAAWVSVTQLPLIYVLSGKANVVSILTGISYERLNWLHRWVSRTMFLTVIVHWSYFFREWYIADFVKLELELMPMVKYGFGAWATLGWMVITGFGFFRTLSYELWLLQHIVAALVLLWLVHTHVPAYARYNVWFAVGIVVFDRLVRTLRMVIINFRLRPAQQAPGPAGRWLGYDAEVKSLPLDFIRVTIRHVRFSWRAGQHVYLSIPRAGIVEAHPFTIANLSRKESGSDGPDSIELVIRAHSGFTRRLYRHCQGAESPQTFRSFISGPWGAPPSIKRFESLILMATGNGSSFTVPIFQKALLSANHLRQIRFVWVIRHPDQLDWFKEQLLATWRAAQHRNIAVSIYIFITQSVRDRYASPTENNSLLDSSSESQSIEEKALDKASKDSRESRELLDLSMEKKQDASVVQTSATRSSSTSFEEPALTMGYGRPSFDSLVRPVVEAAWGETGIIACGGADFMGSVRNYVAGLSDERGVHKGTGAQGIYLFCETYGW